MLRPVLERVFHLSEQHTSVGTEVAAGLTTFLTMAYIIFVQPTVLSAAGMDFGAVLVAMLVMPLAVSITEGIAFGFVAYAVLKIAAGRAGDAHWLVHLFAVLFLVRYIWLSR
jgi:xanthine/uracil/vitamin C permease (AzgA family)